MNARTSREKAAAARLLIAADRAALDREREAFRREIELAKLEIQARRVELAESEARRRSGGEHRKRDLSGLTPEEVDAYLDELEGGGG